MPCERFYPKFKEKGSRKWRGFPNAYSFGTKRGASKFVKSTRKKFKRVDRKGKFKIARKP